MPANLTERTDVLASRAAHRGATAPELEPPNFATGISLVSRVAALRWLSALVRIAGNRGVASIANQSLVSATNFFTTVIIGRAAGQENLGAFTLAFSVTLVMLALQDSLICQPYMVRHRHCRGASRRRFAGSTLVQAAFLAAVLLVLTVSGAAVVALRDSGSMAKLPLALSLAVPFMLLRELARRMSFAHLLINQALAIDSIVMTVQLGLLLVLWRIGFLSAATAYVVIAVACGMAGMFWLWSFRFHVGLPGQRLLADIRRGWNFGRWVLGSQVLTVLSTYLVYWMVAGELGTNASGILTACSAIILLSNPIVFGTCNYLVPRLAAALAEEGNAGMLRVALWATLFLASVMSVLSVVAFVFGEAFLHLVYGSAFAGNATVSGLYGLAMLAQVVGSAPDYMLWVKQRPVFSFWSALLGVCCLVAMALLLMPMWGLAGAVTAMAIANAMASAARWMAAWHLVHAPTRRSRP